MNDPGVVEWLRGPEGEQWSRGRVLAGDPELITFEPVLWRARGPLRRDLDPCGSGPLQGDGGGWPS